MIHAAVTIIAPPGQREGIRQALLSLLIPTRVQPGCLDCRLQEDVETAGTFTLVEEWSSVANFEHRLRSEAYRQLLLTMELADQPPVVRFQVISQTMGLEAVHAARDPERGARGLFCRAHAPPRLDS